MNVGYFFYGHLGDKLSPATVNTPDGNAWYSSSIISELIEQNHRVFFLGIDRDKNDLEALKVEPIKLFEAFETKNRLFAYSEVHRMEWEWDSENAKNILTLKNPPDLDLILLEWRFPIANRNTQDDINSDKFQPDYMMQKEILDVYAGNTPIIIFDLDYKLTQTDEEELIKLDPVHMVVFETSVDPKKYLLDRVSVDIPFWMNSQIRYESSSNPNKKLAYVGSNYERSDVINDYIYPFSKMPENIFKVWFYGNWRNYPDKYEELYTKYKWYDIQYHFRVGHKDFREVYQDAIACPLLAKREYYKRGFMTARIQEAIYFGTVPVGFKEHLGIEKYLTPDLIANDANELHEIVNMLSKESNFKRHLRRHDLWHRLNFMDCSFFVKKMMEQL